MEPLFAKGCSSHQRGDSATEAHPLRGTVKTAPSAPCAHISGHATADLRDHCFACTRTGNPRSRAASLRDSLP